MKILLVAHSFPPYNTVGTVRVGKMAKYLLRQGHDLRVLTAAPQPLPEGLPVEIPEDRIHRTRWVNLRAPAERAGAGNPAEGPVGGRAPGAIRALLRATVWSAYREIVGYPDLLVGWLPFAVREGERICRDWRPDVVYASAPPYTSLLVGSAIARRCRVPWVAELRDLWMDTHNYPYSRLRRAAERRTERAVLSTAAGLVTVSAPLAERLRARFPAPVGVVMNGFDPADYPTVPGGDEGPMLRIAYTGSAHPSYQDPTALLQAIASSPELRGGVRVDFYGPRLGFVRELAARIGVAENVAVHGPVPYAESLRVQRKADVLLFLAWNDPAQRGVLTGKLFEYFGARRPILSVGRHPDEASALVVERGAGTAVYDASQVAEALAGLVVQKAGSRMRDLPESVGAALTREAQAEQLGRFLERVAGGWK